MLATGVGHFRPEAGNDPDSITLVWGIKVGGSHNTPPHAIPHFGKVTDDHGKASSHKHW